MLWSDVAEQNDLHVVRELMDCLDKVPAIKQEAMCRLKRTEEEKGALLSEDQMEKNVKEYQMDALWEGFDVEPAVWEQVLKRTSTGSWAWQRQ